VLIEALRKFEQSDRTASTIAELAGGDVEAQAFVILMEATKSADEDLKAIMAEVKAINNAKQQLRSLISKINKDVAANNPQANKLPGLNFSSGMGTEEAYHHAPIPVPDFDSAGGVRLVLTDLHNGTLVSVTELRAVLDDLRGQLDSMSELSEMTSLRLQMTLDRRSKFISTLSNVMKKISTTSDILVQNIK
jgi:hypothetical protein